jgi:diaminopimelate epimerase
VAARKLQRGELVKYHGLGNDYLVIDAERFGARLTAARVRALCERHRGAGADGIVALAGRTPDGFRVRIYNPDGSQAEKSGNGLRIFARALFDLGYTRKRRFVIDTPGGSVEAVLAATGNRVTLGMGRANFSSTAVPVAGPEREVLQEPLDVDGEAIHISCVSVGNPHCVVLVSALDRAQLLHLGPALENHALFPKRINVQLAHVRSRKQVDVLVWERGAGETQASGTSSCAVAAVCARLDLVDGRVAIGLPGGTLPVRVAPDFSLELTGPATPVYRATLL